MRFHVSDAPRLDPGYLERLADERFLGEPVGRGQAVRAPVLVEGGAPNHRVDAVAVTERAGERLQDDHAGPLAAHEPVGAGVEALAASIGGHRLQAREAEGDGRGQDQVDAPREGDLGLAARHALAGQMGGGERGRAGGVDGEAGTAEVEQVRDTVGGDAERAAGVAVTIRVVRPAQVERAVVVRRDPDEDADRASRASVEGQACVLERFPRRLEQEPLLRVHVRRLARGDAEEGRIEEIDPVQEPAPS